MAQHRFGGGLSTRGAGWMLLKVRPDSMYQSRSQTIVTNANVGLTAVLGGINLIWLASRSCAMHRGI